MGETVGCRSESVHAGAREGAQAARSSPLHGLVAHGDDQEIHQEGWGGRHGWAVRARDGASGRTWGHDDDTR